MIIVHVAASKKGIQYTVSMTSSCAGDRLIIFKNPNQKNMINKGILTRKSLVLNLYINYVYSEDSASF